MGARIPMHFVLTDKGSEELTSRTYRLDLKLRNILFLIQRGTPTVEAILQNTVVPRDEVVEKLRDLLKEQFVVLSGSPPTMNGIVPPPTLRDDAPAPAAEGERAARGSPLTLAAGVSLSQARFVLCDYCLDHFGMNAQPLIDAINAAGSLGALQKTLDHIAAEMQRNAKGELPALVERVREINENFS